MTNATTETTIDALNDVTKTMIDSYKGYEKCLEVSNDSHVLHQDFRHRAQSRSELINSLQGRVRTLGGEPETDGSMKGAAHRALTQVSSIFRDDEKAALSAIDDGEEYLAEKIKDKMEISELDGQSRQLLQDAYTNAKAGERFADRMQKFQ